MQYNNINSAKIKQIGLTKLWIFSF